jgi:hypothetical protein
MITARPGFPRFSGSFKSFSISQSSNREKGTESRLLVFSQGNRAAVSEFLWLKWLWDELSRDEMRLFLILPETLNSDMKYAALRAVLLYGKENIRYRILGFPFQSSKESPTRLRYQGYKRLDVEIYEFSRNLPRVPKFSGYIKSASAVGTKRPGGPSFLEPLAVIENDYTDKIFDWYSYLTVDDRKPLPSEEG